MSADFAIGSCVDCGRTLVLAKTWQRFPKCYREALLRHGFATHHGRSLCSGCYGRRRAADELIDVERRTLTRDELLDEWHFFVKDRDTYAQNVKAFARHLSRDWRAIEKGLTRAGVGAANPNRRREDAA